MKCEPPNVRQLSGKRFFENIDVYILECEQKLFWVIKLEVPIKDNNIFRPIIYMGHGDLKIKVN